MEGTNRKNLLSFHPVLNDTHRNMDGTEAEGGCGVIGLACTEPVAGKHILQPSLQMHNRGNGKGGGLAAVGLNPTQMMVSPETLEQDYLIQVALLDPTAKKEVESLFLEPYYEIHQGYEIPHVADYHDISGLEVRPPDILRYFVRVKPSVLEEFVISCRRQRGLRPKIPLPASLAGYEDEFVYQNTYRLNQTLYASLGEKRAFVLSHGKNMLVFKIVGYAEQAVYYYQLENLQAHIWISHQRYPTKGKVWHPGGAHPFVGLHEALVHNGDFANYHSISEYLKQRGIYPLFLTDTEVSALLFDLLKRVYRYPLEYVIEALAPTTERDFVLLPPEKQEIYRAIQATHIHGSPDGPWFFIIARNDPLEKTMQLIGITDTSMLRPQVFALAHTPEGSGFQPVHLGLIASEKQAIDAVLRSLRSEDLRFSLFADQYWNARGGSHTDGGAFIFSLKNQKLSCTDKFGKVVKLPDDQWCTYNPDWIQSWEREHPEELKQSQETMRRWVEFFGRREDPFLFFQFLNGEIEFPHSGYHKWHRLKTMGYSSYEHLGQALREWAEQSVRQGLFAIEVLTLLIDRRYDIGAKRRCSLLTLLHGALYKIFQDIPCIDEQNGKWEKGEENQAFFTYPPPASLEAHLVRVDWKRRETLSRAPSPTSVLVVDVGNFPPEGEGSISEFLVKGYRMGWREFITYNWQGQRFCGCGMGSNSRGVRIQVYGCPGDYLASGLDGGEIIVHGSGQDQLAQIMKDGKLVIHGDVGQTFLYGAKGGEIYVLGNAAGRPLINAVGRPRVVINGTCLDYLAESFMAGNPLKGGGFVILNGVYFDEHGRLKEMDTPYPGGNIFSLASGGAIYLRDPQKRVEANQLNGGRFASLSGDDWQLILPYLQENERLFGIRVEDLLTVDGERLPPQEVYRKVEAVPLSILATITAHQ